MNVVIAASTNHAEAYRGDWLRAEARLRHRSMNDYLAQRIGCPTIRKKTYEAIHLHDRPTLIPTTVSISRSSGWCQAAIGLNRRSEPAACDLSLRI